MGLITYSNESKIYTGDFDDPEYFQQHVAYDITATLDDSLHTLSAYEKIIYTNNSPDTLNYIWFHLWPNAYKNTETAFAKQRERFLNKSFIFSEEKKRGYIDSLNFMIDGKEADWTYHSEWIDVAKTCRTCWKTISAFDDFCPKCGHPQGEPDPESIEGKLQNAGKSINKWFKKKFGF